MGPTGRPGHSRSSRTRVGPDGDHRYEPHELHGLGPRPLGRIRVVGRAEPVAIYELLGTSGEATRPDARAIERFERALEDFTAGRFEGATDGFREVLSLCGGGDGPSEFFLDTIERLVAAPPPDGWDGVITFETK